MTDAAAAPRPTVLVVEDEPLLRMDAADLIAQAGFAVIEAGNADDAIEILNTRDDVRIVFTDIDMPGSMDGYRLAMTIRDRWPPIELVITSGHFMLGDGMLPARGRFLPKPYEPKRLVETLRALAG
jgi:CheY-like chemotaxis protein